jgi:hypothetical protein
MRINAAARLSATKNFDNTKHVLNLLGIDAELLKVERSSSIFSLTTPVDQTTTILTRKFGKPSEGHKGDTKMLVWDKFHKEIGIVLEIPSDGRPRMEIYEK